LPSRSRRRRSRRASSSPAAAIVGARAIAIRNAEGKIVAAWNVPNDAWGSLEQGREAPRLWRDAEIVDLEVPGGSLVVWTSPYAPFFGDEELALLRTLGALTGLALVHVNLFQAEHEARLALERANEVKSNFVALAAHELRTPMTTIHGFVTTLHHLSDRLDEEQLEQVRDALLQQTHRMAALIEQLLDLSRLDAEAIDIVPEPIHVRDQVREIVAAVAPDPGAVDVAIDGDTIAVADRSALERIVSQPRHERIPLRGAAGDRARRADRPSFPPVGRGSRPRCRGGVRAGPLRALLAQRGLAGGRRRDRSRARDRPVVRPGPRRGTALRGCDAARRALPARPPVATEERRYPRRGVFLEVGFDPRSGEHARYAAEK